MRNSITLSAVALLAAAAMTASVPAASAASRHHARAAKSASHAGVRFAHGAGHGTGYRPLVSDGYGSGYGFHRLPYPYHAAARYAQDRQSAALRETVDTDALTTGDWDSGYLGSNVYSYGNSAAYGVFNGADGYGSPYFAGYYGPGDGEDYGPFGHAYAD